MLCLIFQPLPLLLGSLQGVEICYGLGVFPFGFPCVEDGVLRQGRKKREGDNQMISTLPRPGRKEGRKLSGAAGEGAGWGYLGGAFGPFSELRPSEVMLQLVDAQQPGLKSAGSGRWGG